MILLTILLNKKKLNINQISQQNIEYIEDYINYRLAPYKQLNYFQFNAFSKKYIDGLNSPSLLIKQLEIYKQNIRPNSGMIFQASNILLNICTNDFNISSAEEDKIKKHTQNYGVMFSYLYH